MSNTSKLVDAVISQIREDIASGDVEALAELLEYNVTMTDMTDYLDDDRLDQYREDIA